MHNNHIPTKRKGEGDTEIASFVCFRRQVCSSNSDYIPVRICAASSVVES
jgi:hypothetical protein